MVGHLALAKSQLFTRLGFAPQTRIWLKTTVMKRSNARPVVLNANSEPWPFSRAGGVYGCPNLDRACASARARGFDRCGNGRWLCR